MQVERRTSPALETLYHFYNDEANLFVTVTMCPVQERDRVFNQIVSNKAWYWGRFAASERDTYMLQRLTVEQIMREDFERTCGKRFPASPTYFYIYPHSDARRLRSDLDRRSEFDGPKTVMLRFELSDLYDTSSITFTLEDSFQSYKHILCSRGMPVRRGGKDLKCTECQGRLFRIGELHTVYARRANDDGIYFEAQVWDPSVLERIKRGSEFRIWPLHT
jgi:hypothetical protein